jgi:hypothetical protein
MYKVLCYSAEAARESFHHHYGPNAESHSLLCGSLWTGQLCGRCLLLVHEQHVYACKVACLYECVDRIMGYPSRLWSAVIVSSGGCNCQFVLLSEGMTHSGVPAGATIYVLTRPIQTRSAAACMSAQLNRMVF